VGRYPNVSVRSSDCEIAFRLLSTAAVVAFCKGSGAASLFRNRIPFEHRLFGLFQVTRKQDCRAKGLLKKFSPNDFCRHCLAIISINLDQFSLRGVLLRVQRSTLTDSLPSIVELCHPNV
jgi:hypothetical protein